MSRILRCPLRHCPSPKHLIQSLSRQSSSSTTLRRQNRLPASYVSRLFPINPLLCIFPSQSMNNISLPVSRRHLPRHHLLSLLPPAKPNPLARYLPLCPRLPRPQRAPTRRPRRWHLLPLKNMHRRSFLTPWCRCRLYVRSYRRQGLRGGFQ